MIGRLSRVAALLGALAVSFGIGWAVGGLQGETNAYHRRFLDDRALLKPILAADPAFSGVEIEELSIGAASLSGEVDSAEDLDRLRAEVIRVFGESRVEEIMDGVSVDEDERPQTPGR
ncbi:hypothetical protein [Tautonia plasticadhaerens]|uniref:BON domain-containing protein n=1 Tax=Tautonia plasticadhaerens TaxID=2527974 RepID=A0A518HCA8_9BACT|nr:hypothetical protein [Tautonia plasticadhaerens]QDV38491.1 hypothetical protein ElP_64460 [Tautonia plasticadhaerens]